MSPSPPALSIVITSYNARDSIGNCLTSLAEQTGRERCEVIVVDSSTDGTGDLVARDFPDVRLLCSAHRLYPGDARNRGIAAARAQIIAFMDADCTLEPAWADDLLAVHAAGHPVVASAIDNGARGSLVGWTYYFCEFNLWLPAVHARFVPEAAGCCLSFNRALFDRYGPFLTGTYCSDTAFHWKLQAAGQLAYFAPTLRVYHHATGSFWELLRHVYGHRRAFARVKCQARRLSWLGRLGELALEPGTPVLLLGAVGLRLRHCPAYLPVFAAVSPFLLLAFGARALGEIEGYLTAPSPPRETRASESDTMAAPP